MILESTLSDIIEHQMQQLGNRDLGLERELNISIPSISSHALIISGIRRCGKSTLLMQILSKMKNEKFIFINFESPRLYDFTLADFTRLDKIISQKEATTLFFDEIQYIPSWELYVRQKLDEGYKVIITGSNASLLSKELGTKLTGRHVSKDLFPFSYTEFLTYKKLLPAKESLEIYMQSGGFPEFVKNAIDDHLITLFDDIIVRDIVARFGIKDIKSLQRLAVYLYTNVGNRITATKLKQPLSIGATSTILSWFSHLELSYLVSFLPMFSYSTKAQLINPRKVYAIDLGLLNLVSNNLKKDNGHKLENLIFLHLRRKYKEIYYFDQDGECDFVAMVNEKAVEIVQVTYQLTEDNFQREVNGLIKALKFFGKDKGLIISMNDSDTFVEDGYNIDVVPAYIYLSETFVKIV